MSLVPSLLQAILKVDGEALVMHAGEKPYVVAPSGQIELASRGLTLEAVNGIVSQLLPADALRALEEFGAVQQELAGQSEFPGESFTVVAARGGDDVWVEIRRRRIPDDDRVPDEFFSAATAAEADAAVLIVAPLQQDIRHELSPDIDGVQQPLMSDSSDIPDMGPLSQSGLHDEIRPGYSGDEHAEIPIDLEDLTIPDAAQLFESPQAAERDAASSTPSEPPPAHEIPPPAVVPES